MTRTATFCLTHISSVTLALLMSACAADTSTETIRSNLGSAATAQVEDAAVLFVGGFGNKKDLFEDYWNTLQTEYKSLHFHEIEGKFFGADHWKDFAEVEADYDALLAEGHKSIVVVGYSVGGKHAAKLALKRPETKTLALLDPVDGGKDPKNEKTPVFLQDGDQIKTPTLLLASEFGHVPKILDQACAPGKFGHRHFREHIADESLLHYEIVEGSSHLNFIAKPWSFAMAMACDNGKAKHETAMGRILELVRRFLPKRED